MMLRESVLSGIERNYTKPFEFNFWKTAVVPFENGCHVVGLKENLAVFTQIKDF